MLRRYIKRPGVVHGRPKGKGIGRGNRGKSLQIKLLLKNTKLTEADIAKQARCSREMVRLVKESVMPWRINYGRKGTRG
ncbi:MAG: hypothetical protein AABW72_04415 [archaeon]